MKESIYLNNIKHEELAPVCIFCFKRPLKTKELFSSLKKCLLFNESKVYVFIDGPRNEQDHKKVLENYKFFLNEKKSNSNIEIFLNEENQGLASSIIKGVTQVLNLHKKIIVFEDDLLVSGSVLLFFNYMLNHYSSYNDVFSISAFSPPIGIPNSYNYDIYFTRRPFSWGWATWADRWNIVNWEKSYFLKVYENKTVMKGLKQISDDLPRMFKLYLKDMIDSWYIRWVIFHHLNNKLSLYPCQSLIINNGFDNSATHNKGFNYYSGMRLNNLIKEKYVVPKDVYIDKNIQDAFSEFLSDKNKLKLYINSIKSFSDGKNIIKEMIKKILRYIDL